MAAIHGQTVRYGELRPFGHLHWYDRQVLGGVFDLCQLNGEPDLTAVLAPAGEPSEDAVEAERVVAYWREARPVRPSEGRTGTRSDLTRRAARRMVRLLPGTRRP
ncbi:hypothetical protein [Modestobacter excelsi]|uniref:hypothetical protein n=1 Tax=Modestobacter excelsi TaxID=2213161 RepID=UPI00110D1C3B|nr:hypothetical protein [Modestobacter excelsi]